MAGTECRDLWIVVREFPGVSGKEFGIEGPQARPVVRQSRPPGLACGDGGGRSWGARNDSGGGGGALGAPEATVEVQHER
jgi:hypothetical protein